jgi:hypothetical protein
MDEFIILIGQILIIACLQSLMEIFIDADKKPYQAKVLNLACFAGSLYLLIKFVFDFILMELVNVMNFTF